ncbi:MAG: hypothetical protein ACREQQ_09290 [Candidatus Binatia bacterium]
MSGKATRQRSEPAPLAFIRAISAAVAVAVSLGAAVDATGADALFWRERSHGSDSQFTPLTSFINYAGDPLQVPASFDDDDFGSRLDEVLGNLIDPRDAIEEEGGVRAFVNRQILPIDAGELDQAIEAIPNYALHALGGGMLYRKNAEWLAAHGYRWPRTLAAGAAMAAEILQEVLEKRATDADDEVADVWLFRPAGILLFNHDGFARFAAERLRLVEWPHQPMIDPADVELTNVGVNFVVRPTFLELGRQSPFVYFGMNPLFGASHPIGGSDALSWGAGVAVVSADRRELGLRPSGGLFWDREDSLLAALIANATDDFRIRLNVYPGMLPPRSAWSPGLFFGVKDDAVVVAGITVRVAPLGIAGFWR